MPYFGDTAPKEKDTHKLTFTVEARGPAAKLEAFQQQLLEQTQPGVTIAVTTTRVEAI